nr:structural protein [Tolivirales sp.]
MRKTKSKTARGKRAEKSKQPKTPFGDVGEVLGRSIGKMFNLNLGGAGRWLGSGIGSIFGSGDYQVMGPAPNHNVLFNTAQVPKFSTTHATNVIAHREYVSDIYGTDFFTNRTYDLNPSNEAIFPWLSSIAHNYQQYKFHGIIIEFKPLITDFITSGAPGVIIMATNYDVNDPPYTSKQSMENSEFAVSVKPTCSLVHGIECDPNQTNVPIKYVRSPTSNLDNPLYDWGKLQVATQGNPNGQLIGELWVSYLVEFYKPTLPPPGVLEFTGAIDRTSVASANPLGLVQIASRTNFDFTSTNRVVTMRGLEVGAYYMLSVRWVGGAAALTIPGMAVVNGELTDFFLDAVGAYQLTRVAPFPSGVVSQTMTYDMVFKVSTRASETTPVTVTFDTAGVFPTSCYVQIVLDSVNPAAVP